MEKDVEIKCSACSLKATYNVALSGKRSLMCYQHAKEFQNNFGARIEPIARLDKPSSPRVWRF